MKRVTRFLEVTVLAVFVFLLWSNVRLRAELKALRAEHAFGLTALRSFQAGDAFDAGRLTSCHGCATAPFPTGRKIVIVVNPVCESCEEAARDLVEILPTLRVPPVVISTGNDSATTKFASKYGFGRFTFLISPGTPRKQFMTTPQVFLANDTRVLARCRSVRQCIPR